MTDVDKRDGSQYGEVLRWLFVGGLTVLVGYCLVIEMLIFGFYAVAGVVNGGGGWVVAPISLVLMGVGPWVIGSRTFRARRSGASTYHQFRRAVSGGIVVVPLALIAMLLAAFPI